MGIDREFASPLAELFIELIQTDLVDLPTFIKLLATTELLVSLALVLRAQVLFNDLFDHYLRISWVAIADRYLNGPCIDQRRNTKAVFKVLLRQSHVIIELLEPSRTTQFSTARQGIA